MCVHYTSNRLRSDWELLDWMAYMNKRTNLLDDVQPLSQDEITRFRDQFNSLLLKRFLRTIEIQRAEIDELKALRGSNPRPAEAVH